MEEKEIKNLEEKLEARMKSSAVPDPWEPEEEGDSLMAQITDIRPEPKAWRDDPQNPELFYVVKPADGGDKIRLPSHTVLQQLLENENPSEGSYVKVRYLGERKSKRGRPVKNYELGVLPQEGTGEELGESKTAEEVKEAATEVETEPEEEAKEVQEVVLASEDLGEFVEDLFEFYSTMEVEDFDNYLNNIRDFDIEPEKAAKIAGLEIEEGIVRKKD